MSAFDAHVSYVKGARSEQAAIVAYLRGREASYRARSITLNVGHDVEAAAHCARAAALLGLAADEVEADEHMKGPR